MIPSDLARVLNFSLGIDAKAAKIIGPAEVNMPEVRVLSFLLFSLRCTLHSTFLDPVPSNQRPTSKIRK